MTISRDEALARDDADPLAGFAARYVPLGDDVIAYLDGNSLGRPLLSIGQVWANFYREQWGGRLIRGWSEGWMELPGQVGDELGAAALGAAAGQTVIADSTTVNFYKAMRAALNLRPDRKRIILDRDNFPTDRYVVESLARDHGLELIWFNPQHDGGVTLQDLAEQIDERVAVVTLSHVAYRSGYLADIEAITALAHEAGALVVWDQSHAVGAVPIELDAWDVDFAVGCTYKFVGAGPGAPAFAYVNRRHHESLDQPIWGWFGRRNAFAMEPGYVPAGGVSSMLSGTPPVLGVLAVREGAAVIAEAGIRAIRAKGVELTDMAIDLFDAWLAPQGCALGSPRRSGDRGAHVSVTRADAREVCAQLVTRGVLPDFRTPNAIRVGLSPLSCSFVELWDAMQVFGEVVTSQA